jgi:hypothetical protein
MPRPSGILRAVTADAADISFALLEGREAAIGALAIQEACTPRLRRIDTDGPDEHESQGRKREKSEGPHDGLLRVSIALSRGTFRTSLVIVSEPVLLQPVSRPEYRVRLQADRLTDRGVRLFMAGAPSGIEASPASFAAACRSILDQLRDSHPLSG